MQLEGDEDEITEKDAETLSIEELKEVIDYLEDEAKNSFQKKHIAQLQNKKEE